MGVLDEIGVDDRIEEMVINGVVDMRILVVVNPKHLHKEKCYQER